ncbi:MULTISPECIES: PadR family transcriptional regulator [unclassified Luteococcus]|uniref:PadR family transcriptional regulator n=1 Tax=unclassified Luteococcus TaxID=2639923 RepID=UPI00313F2E31
MKQPWPSEWLRGTLTLAVLRVLADGPTYGYAIANALEDAGFGAIKGGTLYPLLSRLETNGLVETEWREGEGGPGRKYFLLSDSGRAQYASQSVLWREFCAHTVDFINPLTTDQIPEA